MTRFGRFLTSSAFDRMGAVFAGLVLLWALAALIW